MKLLFLDTETTDISPHSGQIIEIAGVVAELDKNSLKLKSLQEVSSLVSLRHQMDEKITRITGITKEELASAPNQRKVQEKWANWLESKEIEAIVGHSVYFDLGFLESEGWFLPEKTKIIDTLELTKILFPEVQAVNLDYLCGSFKIHQKLERQMLEETGKNEIQAHRALYDSKCCLEIFRVVLTKLTSLKASDSFYNRIEQLVLPLGITYLESNKVEIKDNLEKEDNSPEIEHLRLTGEIPEKGLSHYLNKKYSSTDYSSILESLQELFSLEIDRSLALVIPQLYVIFLLKGNNGNSGLKLHLHGYNQVLFAEILMSHLNQRLETTEKKDTVKRLARIEGLIYQVENILSTTFDAGRLFTLLEILLKLKEAEKLENHQELLKLLSSYDFLLVSLQTLLLKSEYSYNPSRLKPEETAFQKKFQSLCYHLNKANLKPVGNKFTDFLISKINEQLDIFKRSDISSKKKYLFTFQKNNLLIKESKSVVNLQNHFTTLLTNNPKLEITSYLSKEDLHYFFELSGLEDLLDKYPVTVQNLIGTGEVIQTFEHNPALREFYIDLTQKAVREKSSILVLCGQNSTIKDSQKVLTEELSPGNFLLLGESGSLTKISSKLSLGFKGLAVCKVNDYYYLQRSRSLQNVSQVWIINFPYFKMHPFWQQLAKESGDTEAFTGEIKSLYLKSLAGIINYNTGLKVNYLKNYHL